MPSVPDGTDSEASEGTPWVPAGRSGWEFGTNEDVKAKADSDFEKSVKALDKKGRAETTFFSSPLAVGPEKPAGLRPRKARKSQLG